MKDERYAGMASTAIHAAGSVSACHAHTMPISATSVFTFNSIFSFGEEFKVEVKLNDGVEMSAIQKKLHLRHQVHHKKIR